MERIVSFHLFSSSIVSRRDNRESLCDVIVRQAFVFDVLLFLMKSNETCVKTCQNLC